MSIKCNHCGAGLGDPQMNLEAGELDTFVAHKVHPTDSIAVCQTWYYCDPQCFVGAHGEGDSE